MFAKINSINTLLNSKFQVYSFYEKSGYKTVSEPFYDVGIKHIKMEKALK